MQSAENDIGSRWLTSKSGGFLFVIIVKDFLQGYIKVELKLFLNAQFPDLVIAVRDNL